MYDASFFGFLDPDGRPWGHTFADYDKYQHLVETSLKIAFLTQHKLPIPAGYFLDNLAIQRVFMKYSGNSKEGLCFRELAKHCIVIAANESEVHTDAVTDWNGIMNEWALGSGSNRNRFAYLNCLPHPVAKGIQQVADPTSYRKELLNAMYSTNKFDYVDYLNKLDTLNFKRKELGNFDFDTLIRTKLLAGTEQFPQLSQASTQKLVDIADKALQAKIRISRSVIINEKLCLDLGVPKSNTISHVEYQHIAPILAHYHQYAFTKALGLSSYVTPVSPLTPANETFRQRIHSIGQGLSGGNGECTSFPLKDIGFEDIYKARLGHEDHLFIDNLQKVHQSISNGSEEDYIESNKAHYQHIQKVITHGNYTVSLQQLEDSINGTVMVGEPTASGILALAKGSWTFFKEFYPNIKRRHQLNSFFRSIENPSSVTSTNAGSPKLTATH